MPTTCRIAKDEGIVYVDSEGRVDLESMIESVIEVTGSPDFSPHFRVLSDLREIEYQPAVSEAIDFGHFMGTLHALLRDRIAAVLSNPVHYRLSKIVCLLARARGIEMQSFRDMESARAWLLSDPVQALDGSPPRRSDSAE